MGGGGALGLLSKGDAGREAANKKSIMDVTRIRSKKRTKAGGLTMKLSGDCGFVSDKQKINSGPHAPSWRERAVCDGIHGWELLRSSRQGV